MLSLGQQLKALDFARGPDLAQSKQMAKAALFERCRKIQFNHNHHTNSEMKKTGQGQTDPVVLLSSVSGVDDDTNTKRADNGARERSSSKEHFKLVQKNLASVSKLVHGGERRRASKRLEDNPLTLSQRLDIVERVDCLKVLSKAGKRSSLQSCAQGCMPRAMKSLLKGILGVSSSSSRRAGRSHTRRRTIGHDHREKTCHSGSN